MIGATVQPSAPPRAGSLPARLLSAALLIPAVLLVVYLGSPYMEALVLLGAALLGWEWAGLCGADRPLAAQATVVAGVLAAVGLGALGQFGPALLVLLGATLAAGALAALLRLRHPLWLALGLPYLALPCLALLWLRFGLEAGAAVVFWLLLVIWATDSGAYFAGLAIGGPKLAPRISPKKTWAGLVGGMAAAALIGASGRWLLPEHPLAPMILFAALVAALSQGGDLFESFVKRRFGVKDAGRLIPGHGGLLDRVDGLIVGVLALAAVLLWRSAPA